MFKKESYYCKPCSKPFKSKNKLHDHERSKKHKKRLQTLSKQSASCEKSQVKIEAIAENDLHKRCLFCHFRGDSFEEILEHSKKEHSFFFLGLKVVKLILRFGKLCETKGTLRRVSGQNSFYFEEMHFLW